MNLSIALGLDGVKGGAAAPASLIDFNDFVESNASFSDIISPTSARMARTVASSSVLLTATVAAGTYRIQGNLSAYDGDVPDITLTRLNIQDNFTNRVSIIAAGAVDQTVSIASGTLRFTLPSAGSGFRFDDLFVSAA